MQLCISFWDHVLYIKSNCALLLGDMSTGCWKFVLVNNCLCGHFDFFGDSTRFMMMTLAMMMMASVSLRLPPPHLSVSEKGKRRNLPAQQHPPPHPSTHPQMNNSASLAYFWPTKTVYPPDPPIMVRFCYDQILPWWDDVSSCHGRWVG